MSDDAVHDFMDHEYAYQRAFELGVISEPFERRLPSTVQREPSGVVLFRAGSYRRAGGCDARTRDNDTCVPGGIIHEIISTAFVDENHRFGVV